MLLPVNKSGITSKLLEGIPFIHSFTDSTPSICQALFQAYRRFQWEQASVPHITAAGGVWTNKWATVIYQDKPVMRGAQRAQYGVLIQTSRSRVNRSQLRKKHSGNREEHVKENQGKGSGSVEPECGFKGLEKPQMRGQRNRQGWDCTVRRRQNLILKATDAIKVSWGGGLILTGRHFISLLF